MFLVDTVVGVVGGCWIEWVLRWLRVGRTVNGINTVVVSDTGLKNAVIGVAVVCGTLRLRLPFHLCVLFCILCYLCCWFWVGNSDSILFEEERMHEREKIEKEQKEQRNMKD